MPRTPADTVKPLRSIAWDGGLENGRLVVLDQTRLPGSVRYLALRDLESVRLAITELLIEALEGLNLDWPPADFDVEHEKARLEKA